MNADLKSSLEGAFRTKASITSQSSAEECIAQANDYWIKTHLNEFWCIINTDITLHTNLVRTVTNKHVELKTLGLLQKHTLRGQTFENTLWIYSTDQYTETWVHELILTMTYSGDDTTNRVLNISREDKGPLIDLGKLSLPG